MSNDATVAEAADELGVSGRRIRQWIAEGRMSAVKRGPFWMLPRPLRRPPDGRRKGPR